MSKEIELKNKLAIVLDEIANSGYDLSEITGWTNVDDETGEEEYPVTGEQAAEELFEWLERSK